MKINEKQIDDIARCLGNVAVAAAIGLAVGLTGYASKPLTEYDKLGLIVAFVLCSAAMLLIRKGR
jgi:hypothetical protein